ncbi:hypothetical protein L2725_04600 [Shewanella corallii]|uniref:Uncharacterized protein n=1 Tax=Shewanella corallii TaxID=560080 RepID=A0ABT0N5A6_9GAMM|nr:hypothetical protein [Shewanella corallii]MCL2913066.1 hypothetical protein [Shewanella corallii]
MKRFTLLALAMMSPAALAGTWYEDWNVETITTYVDVPVYEGSASCRTSSGRYISDYIRPTNSSSACLSANGGYSLGYCGGSSMSCSAGVPFSRMERKAVTTVRRTPIQPYPSDVAIERLGCVGQNGRKIMLSTNYAQGASGMKVYMASSPDYPETLVYNGSYNSNMLLTVYPGSNTVNIRVKLDNGSSYYSVARYMECSGGGRPPRPLD